MLCLQRVHIFGFNFSSPYHNSIIVFWKKYFEVEIFLKSNVNKEVNINNQITKGKKMSFSIDEKGEKEFAKKGKKKPLASYIQLFNTDLFCRPIKTDEPVSFKVFLICFLYVVWHLSDP